jgi:hypothetical protein
MTTTTNAVRDCYFAIELSQKSWLIGILRPDDTKVSTHTVGPGDTAAVRVPTIGVVAQVLGRARG